VARAARRARWQAEVAGLLLSASLGACASMAPPPGAPPDSTPPRVLLVSPESGAVVPDLKGDAVIGFDEVIDEMPGGGGGLGAVTGIGRQVVLSPVNGPVEASWHRTTIHVKPAEGWKPNRVYRLQLLPGVLDLRHNIMKQGRTVIFSTGAPFGHSTLSGIALQWVEQHALTRAVIRAQPLPDTVAYVTIADSSGAFTLKDLPLGPYRVFAIQDGNANRRLDPHEAFDTATVTLAPDANVVLWTFVHDTAGPHLRSVDPVDSLSVRLQFSQPVDPNEKLGPDDVDVLALPDSTPLPVKNVWTAAEFDSVQTRARAVADSIRHANDTTTHAPARRDTTPAPAGNPKRDTTHVKPDTSKVRALLRERPVPTDRYVVTVGRALIPGSRYAVRVRDVKNLNDAIGHGQSAFTVPVPKPTPAGKDSARVRAPSPAPAPAAPTPTPAPR